TRTSYSVQAAQRVGYSSVRGVQTCAVLISSRRRHTRFKCDWSSDVCSSDLTHIYTHTHTHTYTHTTINTHTHTFIYTHHHKHTHTHSIQFRSEERHVDK